MSNPNHSHTNAATAAVAAADEWDSDSLNDMSEDEMMYRPTPAVEEEDAENESNEDDDMDLASTTATADSVLADGERRFVMIHQPHQEVIHYQAPPVAAADSASSASGWGNFFQSSADKWKCEVCMAQNLLTQTSCAACETPRTGREPTVASFSPWAGVGSSSIRPGGFSLGGASSSATTRTTMTRSPSGRVSVTKSAAPAFGSSMFGDSIMFGDSMVHQLRRERVRPLAFSDVNGDNDNHSLSRPRNGPHLMDIPPEVLQHLLGFTMMNTDKYEFATEQWKWVAQLSRVCQLFRHLTKEVAPTSLVLTNEEYRDKQDLDLALVRSFRQVPWKRNNLQQIHCSSQPVFQIVRYLFFRPLPNLTTFHLHLLADNGRIAADSLILNALARNAPQLAHLSLAVTPLGIQVSPAQLTTFCSTLQRPLLTLSLIGCTLTNAHIEVILSLQGASLVELNLDGDDTSDEVILSNSTLDIITRYCQQLAYLSVKDSTISSIRLGSFLQANPNLKRLNVSGCQSLTPKIIFLLAQFAPQLEWLSVEGCTWFTDECLEQLVQGQVEYWVRRQGADEIALMRVDAAETPVTALGVGQVVTQPHLGRLDITPHSSGTPWEPTVASL